MASAMVTKRHLAVPARTTGPKTTAEGQVGIRRAAADGQLFLTDFVSDQMGAAPVSGAAPVMLIPRSWALQASWHNDARTIA